MLAAGRLLFSEMAAIDIAAIEMLAFEMTDIDIAVIDIAAIDLTDMAESRGRIPHFRNKFYNISKILFQQIILRVHTLKN